MSSTANTYLPREAHQPRGGRPWCSTCRTDRHLLANSVTVLSSREDTLALAVTCSRCGGSRVLATTATLAADVLGRAGTGDTSEDGCPCRPPTRPAGRTTKDTDDMTGHTGPTAPTAAKENE